MSIHFHPLVVKEVHTETPSCVSVSFIVPPALTNTFSFTQGQNITLKAIINGQEQRRSYSICTAPHEKELRVAIKKVAQGLFSTYANQKLKAGDIIEVLPPTGKFFTPLNAQHKKNYLAFAAGSGITPILSIIKATLQQEPQSQFTLVYGNQSRNSIIFFEALEGLKNKYINRFHLIHILSREKTDAAINHGRIDIDKCHLLSEKLLNLAAIDEAFICGPEAMIFDVSNWLQQKGVSKKAIHFELFTTPGSKTTVASNNLSTAANNNTSTVTIKLDGRSTSFNLSQQGIPVLEAALQQGLDLPYACKGGVCCTCRAKLISGQVAMDVNWALEPEEVAQGFILTCQSHPLTDEVVIDFDVR
jgi:ring-1,2-phenylacetyl-CoA epoxidase subunit PaaE